MSSQKSLVIKIFAVGHRKIIDFPALAKNDKLLSFLQKSGAFCRNSTPNAVGGARVVGFLLSALFL